MARATVNTQTVPAADSLVATYAAASVDGASIAQGAVLHVKNASGGSINVTVQTPEVRDGLAVADQIEAVGAGAEAFIRPGAAATFGRPSGGSDPGRIWVDFSAVTSVTIAAIGLG